MGKNYFIHSATSVGVSYSALNAPYFGDHYAGARRMVEADAALTARTRILRPRVSLF